MKTKKSAKNKLNNTRKTKSKPKRPKTAKMNELWHHDNRAAIALIDEWMKDDSGYDERVWPEIKAALEANRLGQRKLFRD